MIFQAGVCAHTKKKNHGTFTKFYVKRNFTNFCTILAITNSTFFASFLKNIFILYFISQLGTEPNYVQAKIFDHYALNGCRVISVYILDVGRPIRR